MKDSAVSEKYVGFYAYIVKILCFSASTVSQYKYISSSLSSSRRIDSMDSFVSLSLSLSHLPSLLVIPVDWTFSLFVWRLV